MRGSFGKREIAVHPDSCQTRTAILEAVSGGEAHDAFLVADVLKLVKDLLAHFIMRYVVDRLVTCNDVIATSTSII